MSRERPENRVTQGISIHEPLDLCEGHAAEENELMAKLFGKDSPPLSQEERDEAMTRLDVIQNELAERNARLDMPSGAIWQGMKGR